MVEMLKRLSRFVLETLPQMLATLIAGVVLSMYHGHTFTWHDLIDPSSAKEQSAATAGEERHDGAAAKPAGGEDAQPKLAEARPGDATPAPSQPAQTKASTGVAAEAAAKAKAGAAKAENSAAANARPAARSRPHHAALVVKRAPSSTIVLADVPIRSYPLEPNLTARAELAPPAPPPPVVAMPPAGPALARLVPPQPIPPEPVPSGPSPAAAADPAVAGGGSSEQPARVLGVAVPAPVAAIGGALDPRPVIRASEWAFKKIANAAESMVPDFP